MKFALVQDGLILMLFLTDCSQTSPSLTKHVLQHVHQKMDFVRPLFGSFDPMEEDSISVVSSIVMETSSIHVLDDDISLETPEFGGSFHDHMEVESLCAGVTTRSMDSSGMNTSNESSDSAFALVPGIRRNAAQPRQQVDDVDASNLNSSNDQPIDNSDMADDESNHAADETTAAGEEPAQQPAQDDSSAGGGVAFDGGYDDEEHSDDPNNPHNEVPPRNRADVLNVFRDEGAAASAVEKNQPKRARGATNSAARAASSQQQSSDDDDSDDNFDLSSVQQQPSKKKPNPSAREAKKPEASKGGSRKASSLPNPTSRRKKKQNGRPDLSAKDRQRCFVFRKDLYHICSAVQQQQLPTQHVNKHPYWGHIAGKGARGKYPVEFDIFTGEGEEKQVYVQRKNIHIAKPGEEEQTTAYFDRMYDFHVERIADEQNPRIASINRFCRMKDEEVLEATTFTMVIKKDSLEQVWTIHPEGADVTVGDMAWPTSVPSLQGIDWTKSKAEILLTDFFPFVEGMARTMDKYISDERACCYDTVRTQGIQFNDPDDPDPDWKVKQCLLITVAGAIYPEVSNTVTADLHLYLFDIAAI